MSDNAYTPTRASDNSVGNDLYSAYDYVIPARNRILIKTDIQVALPKNTYGRIAPRSGLALKHFIDVGGGVIDPDYRGNIGIILFNFSNEDFTIKKGQRVAQLICERVYHLEVEEVDNLDTTKRNEKGFGSSGI